MLFDGLWRGMGKSDAGRPRKRGILRFFELIGDNLGRFLACNFLCIVGLIPALAGMALGLWRNNFLIVLAAGLLGGAFFGPFYGAMVDGMLHALRDVPGGWWKKYRHAWRRDFRDCLIPGAVLGAILALLASEGFILAFGGTLSGGVYLCTGITLVAATAIFTYFWPQRVFSDLTAVQVFRNSLFMCMAHPLTILKSILLQGLYWALIVVLLPHSTLLMPILGLWFPCLMGLQAVYAQLNADFHMEERLGAADEDEDGENADEKEEET